MVRTAATLAATLRQAVSEKGIEQKDLAARIKKSPGFVADLLNGKKTSARPTTLIAIAKELDLDAQRLLQLGAPKRFTEWQAAVSRGGSR